MSTRLRPIRPGVGSLMPQIPHISADLLGCVVFVPGQTLERVLACSADVIMNECAYARCVRSGEGLRDVGVFRRHALHGTRRPGLVREQAIRGAMTPDGVERAHDEAVAAGLAERTVEAAVRLEAAAPPLGQAGEALHGLALLLGRARRRECGGGGLEELAQLVQLAHVGGREALYEGAAPGHQPNEAPLLEQMQRLAQGSARHAELRRDLLLLDARICRQPTARDRLAQCDQHSIRELLLVVEGHERHRRILYPRTARRARPRISTTLTP